MSQITYPKIIFYSICFQVNLKAYTPYILLINQMECEHILKKYPISIFILALGAFAIGMTEFILMGILPEIAHDLSISISQAGHFVSVYALGVAIGGPIITLCTLRLPRKRLLLFLLAFSIVGNLGCVFSSNYETLLLFRLIASLAHGTFMGISALIAASIVPSHLSSRAISLVFAGLLSSNVFGVPLGTFIGHSFSWRYSFIVIVFLSITAIIGIAWNVPDQKITTIFKVKNEIRAIFNIQIVLALLITFFGFGGMYLAFTYITPVLTTISKFDSSSISLILLVFGIGSTIGSIIGGRLSDWNVMRWLLINLMILAIIMSIITFFITNKMIMILFVFIWGLFSYSLLPTIQTRIVFLAKDAPNLSSTLTNTAFNLSISFASFFGGMMIDLFELRWIFLIGSIQVMLGLIVAITSVYFNRKISLRKLT